MSDASRVWPPTFVTPLYRRDEPYMNDEKWELLNTLDARGGLEIFIAGNRYARSGVSNYIIIEAQARLAVRAGLILTDDVRLPRGYGGWSEICGMAPEVRSCDALRARQRTNHTWTEFAAVLARRGMPVTSDTVPPLADWEAYAGL